VTTTAAPLILRPPLVARVFAVGWGLAVVLIMVTNFRPEDGGSWAGTLVICSAAAFFAWRLFRQGVFGAPDGRLVVRALWRTTTVQREDIAEVAATRVRRSGWVVQLRLRTGSFVRLDVTQVPLRGPFRRRLDRHEAAVRAWVNGRPQPYR
jgi:hypothetical protein